MKSFFYIGGAIEFMVKSLDSGFEVKKMDSHGRIILPADWREAKVEESREMYVIKRKGYLKLVPKRRVDLTEYFDKVDLGVKSIDNWAAFEKKTFEENP